MNHAQLLKEIEEFLKNKEFISVATCNAQGQPSVMSKLLIAFKDGFIYVADYLIGPTFANLKVNPKVSLSVGDANTLVRYQINGIAEIVEKGVEFDALAKELQEKEIKFTANRVVKGVQKEKKHTEFEAAFPERFVVIKIKINEVVKITPDAEMEKESV